MEQCPKCGEWLLSYDPRREMKKCYSRNCDYEEYYCKQKYYIENDVTWKLILGASEPDPKGRCITPKGWRECDACELRH